MERQPNSRMCFVCGIENPIGLKLKFYTDKQTTKADASASSSRSQNTRAIPASCMGV
jgi:hypothetical protein